MYLKVHTSFLKAQYQSKHCEVGQIQWHRVMGGVKSACMEDAQYEAMESKLTLSVGATVGAGTCEKEREE